MLRFRAPHPSGLSVRDDPEVRGTATCPAARPSQGQHRGMGLDSRAWTQMTVTVRRAAQEEPWAMRLPRRSPTG